MGRDFGGIRNGPRVMDLDILFYDHIEFHNDRLTIPHPKIQERFFVLEPLSEYFYINQVSRQNILIQLFLEL
jgi:dihydroneopterin aldolase/2-amino-4-hydroxy-6-hydroxymethyldihydropteridine diphosphokinase/dihydropteroate synthase/2-amino-4-hydroxy-6-hydroxymethyldihydropteridine diphosphokinase/dihydropteroate synthase